MNQWKETWRKLTWLGFAVGFSWFLTNGAVDYDGVLMVFAVIVGFCAGMGCEAEIV